MTVTPRTRSGAHDADDNRTALYQLWTLGGASVALALLTPFAFRIGGDNYYMAMTIPAGVVALIATSVAERAPATKALWLIIGIAIMLRGFLLLTEPLLSTDIYRYVWDGRVQAAGINPYRYVPADDALAALRDAAVYPNINRADYAATIYPPVAQLFFFLVTRLGENITAMRAGMLGCEAATALIIVLLLRRMQRPPTRLVAYAWHPLPMWEIANNGHIDALMIALMMFGLWLASTNRALRGAAVIALGALAKPLAMLTLPAIWRPWDWKMPALVVAIAGACYLPYLSVGPGVLGFLTSGYLNEESFASGETVWPLAAWRLVAGALPYDVAVYFGGAALILAAMGMRAAQRTPRSIKTSLDDIKSMLLVALLLLSPNYPWYFLAVVPFVALNGGAVAWTATIGALLLQEEAGWGDYVPMLMRKSVLYAGILLACAMTARNMLQTARRERGKTS